ncbi:C-type lectin domain family 12 member B-like [Kryptolebias marmoratus]|uniref:C-type lectin domain family 12 member B-like n=1 Tax=Kryptolebias marmoratus TaxID=37003 RepID=UPI0007F8DC31|nr:C-type lectin domain family 12 member B-like [Kryptolebias marmoratus]
MHAVNLSSRNPNVSSSAEEVTDGADYINTAGSAGSNIPAAPGHKFPSFTRTLLPLAACWLILLTVIVLRIYFISVISVNNTKLTAEIQNLKEQNQELQKNLTEQIEKMEETQNELNVSRAQWSIDKYCKQSTDRKCEPCQKGWSPFQSSCYAYNNAAPSDQKTWEEARENCTGKISDLTAVADETEKSHVSSISFPGSGINGYWIGLKAVEGKWRWIDGSELTNNTWVNQPANENQCVISVKDQGTGWHGSSSSWIVL